RRRGATGDLPRVLGRDALADQGGRRDHRDAGHADDQGPDRAGLAHGARPVVVLSDDPTASKKISAFAASNDKWMVAVRMVSEGVDVPRLAVGVYATS